MNLLQLLGLGIMGPKLLGLFRSSPAPALPALPAAPGDNSAEQEAALALRKKKGYRPLFGAQAETSGRAGTILTGPSGIDQRKTLLGS